MIDTSNQSNTFYAIPVRGGSRELPRKNVRPLAGKPLIYHSIDRLLEITSPQNIFVITDCDEIEYLSSLKGVIVLREPRRATGKATLDQVILQSLPDMKQNGLKNDSILLTIQATCPLLTLETLKKASKQASNLGDNKSIMTVTEERHNYWFAQTEIPKLLQPRKNRQELKPLLRETGAIIGARVSDIEHFQTRVILPVQFITTSDDESVDIDTESDFNFAEAKFNKKKILIRADASKSLGTGHIYRALALAYEFSSHEVTIVTLCKSDFIAENILQSHPLNFKIIENETHFNDLLSNVCPDLLIFDILDTSLEQVSHARVYAKSIISFEDTGPGSQAADLVFNDLYSSLTDVSHVHSGISYSVLSPQFDYSDLIPKPFNKNLSNILILFGGTDPSNLTEKVLESMAQVNFDGNVTVILGPGNSIKTLDLKKQYGLNGIVIRNTPYIVKYMLQSDLAISSAGRTISELIKCKTPTICLCQNLKELNHTHASIEHGVLNLGLGEEIAAEQLKTNIQEVINNHVLRKTMYEKCCYYSSKLSSKKVFSLINQQIHS